jgi:plasmid maintenance system antidote protein VapI
MIAWAQPREWKDKAVDLEIIEESALAMAQSTIQNAINKSGVKRAEMARRMQCDRSLISRMLSGNHNLTIKTMARSLAVCGFEVQFQPVPLQWNWLETPVDKTEEVEPVNAGSTALFTEKNTVELSLAALQGVGVNIGTNC